MVSVRIYDRIYPHIRALIFDKDGTLAQSQDYLARQAKSRVEAVISTITNRYPSFPVPSQDIQIQLFTSWGIKIDQKINLVDPAGLLAVGSRRQNTIVTAGYLTPLGLGWIEAVQLVEDAFDQVSMTPEEKSLLTPPIADLAPQLKRLQESELKLALLSADTDDNVRSFATTWDLDCYFDLMMGEQPGLPKPNPQLLHLACDRLQVAPDEVLVFGDSAADIQLGKLGGAAGTIAYTAGWQTAKDIPHADQRLQSITDICLVNIN